MLETFADEKDRNKSETGRSFDKEEEALIRRRCQ